MVWWQSDSKKRKTYIYMIQYCGSVIFTKTKVVVNRFLYLNYWGAFYIYWRFTKCTEMLVYPVCRDIGIALYKILPTKWKRMKEGSVNEKRKRLCMYL